MSKPGAPEEYVRLSLMIDKWFPGYVDAYYGPQEVRESIIEGDKPSIETLEDLAGSLQDPY